MQALRPSRRGAELEIADLVAGAAVVVYYDPRRPSHAVLRPGADASTVVMLLVGVALVVVGLRP